jgi:hypothetical protein
MYRKVFLLAWGLGVLFNTAFAWMTLLDVLLYLAVYP